MCLLCFLLLVNDALTYNPITGSAWPTAPWVCQSTIIETPSCTPSNFGATRAVKQGEKDDNQPQQDCSDARLYFLSGSGSSPAHC
ncbi:hypothetical protein E2C01_086111 [Portunus trituberculatus]|uniref:Secreted protein n=1 Tax=Portunus trituberculatus TaxID=210409 RepID=A0A5B7JAN3_PORTR|nr:hypothetical protein [Portunus trituberculatus]